MCYGMHIVVGNGNVVRLCRVQYSTAQRGLTVLESMEIIVREVIEDFYVFLRGGYPHAYVMSGFKK